MVFPVVMYGCESWTVKKAEHKRIDAFELWFWRRLLRIPCTGRRSNQSILKDISPEYSLEGLILIGSSNTLATWYKELTHGKDPDAGKDRRLEEKGMTEDEMVGWYHSMDMSLRMFQEMEKDMNPDALLHGVRESWTLLNN